MNNYNDEGGKMKNEGGLMLEGSTTISINRGTKRVLDSFKIIKREPYDDVLKRVLDELLNSYEEGHDEKVKKLINERLDSVNRGEVLSTKELRKILFGDNVNEVREMLGKKDCE